MYSDSDASLSRIVKEQEPSSVERSALLEVMEDSPILGVIEKKQKMVYPVVC